MNKWYQNKVYLGLGLLVILLIGGFVFFGNRDTEKVSDVSRVLEKTEDGNVRVVGQIECLPYKKSSDSQDCVKGIMDGEGRYFAIDSAKVKFVENTMPKGTPVVAVGAYFPADMSADESSVFLYDGVIVLKSLERE